MSTNHESGAGCCYAHIEQKPYSLEEIAHLLNQMNALHAAILHFMVAQGVEVKEPGIKGLADAFAEAVKRAAKRKGR